MRTAKILTFFMLFLLVGCKAKEIVVEKPVIVEHTSESHRVDIVRDTIIQKDSTITLIKGDTLIIEKWHHVASVSNMMVADTVRDSIPKVVTVTKTEIKEVEKPLGWWQKTLMWAGGIGLLAIALFLAFKIWIRK